MNQPQPAPQPTTFPPEAAPWVVAALYQFRELDEPAALQERLKAECAALGLCGTLIVAPEGINGTVAGSREAITALHGLLLELGFTQLEYKESLAAAQPFKRMKVRLKKEIVTLGVEVQPRDLVGHYLSPAEWDQLLDDPNVVLIDTRNSYEYQAGTFRGALDPQTSSFREFPAWLEEHRAELEGKKVAMFCTGGIRCEKSTSLLLQEGLTDVYHLQGGILRYLEETPQERSRWEGECFVFDERVTVGHGLQPGHAEMCWSCGWPLGDAERADPRYERGVSCPHCAEQTSEAQKAAFRERQRWFDGRPA
ncbi:rhodanese-related sulfurtransferase [Deinococcus sp. Marseille-Q6407]|uniref:oxygen-dependent tRNA uridine(34) hydroxylase TrhO n=1 Tax=Deinococcus sp. Marseille-Q6407 TaxID=2969223 RepID=UPI0021C14133|nr:rhodanese-related sulfurtransferase [Deinococcus sp. Marseille-Q6407]